MPGQNKFHERGRTSLRADGLDRPCTFISHRAADRAAATAIANMLMKWEMDVWLDDREPAVQSAVASGNDAALVAAIEAGLAASTHLLGVISARTAGSWWVPFEIGSARARGCSVAHVLLTDVTTCPEYIRAGTVIADEESLRAWASERSPWGKATFRFISDAAARGAFNPFLPERRSLGAITFSAGR